MRGRIFALILGFAVLGFVAVAVKLFYLQVINTNFYQSKAAENQTKDLIITPTRGTIYDRNMTELAVSATTQEISVDPSVIRKKGTDSAKGKTDADGNTIPATEEEKAAALKSYQEKIASILSEHLELEYADVLEKIQRDVSYVRIARRVDADISDEIMQELEKITFPASIPRRIPSGIINMAPLPLRSSALRMMTARACTVWSCNIMIRSRALPAGWSRQPMRWVQICPMIMKNMWRHRMATALC